MHTARAYPITAISSSSPAKIGIRIFQVTVEAAICASLQCDGQPGSDFRLFRVEIDLTGNLPPLPGIFPDYMAPVVRWQGGVRELSMMRWCMPCRRSSAAPI